MSMPTRVIPSRDGLSAATQRGGCFEHFIFSRQPDRAHLQDSNPFRMSSRRSASGSRTPARPSRPPGPSRAIVFGRSSTGTQLPSPPRQSTTIASRHGRSEARAKTRSARSGLWFAGSTAESSFRRLSRSHYPLTCACSCSRPPGRWRYCGS